MNRRLRTDLGKRAGVTSGLLGVLCVLAEFCFLFPDLLVTREALPFYKANLGVFKAILWATIGTTFLAGLLSLALLRSKAHGLLGIGLGAVALAMRFTGSVETGPATVGAGLEDLKVRGRPLVNLKLSRAKVTQGTAGAEERSRQLRQWQITELDGAPCAS